MRRGEARRGKCKKKQLEIHPPVLYCSYGDCCGFSAPSTCRVLKRRQSGAQQPQFCSPFQKKTPESIFSIKSQRTRAHFRLRLIGRRSHCRDPKPSNMAPSGCAASHSHFRVLGRGSLQRVFLRHTEPPPPPGPQLPIIRMKTCALCEAM
jgi:hypothetical protein